MASKLGQIGPNRPNVWFFQIIFQYTLARRAKMYWNVIWKSPGFAHLGPIWPSLRAKMYWNVIWKSPGFVTFGFNLTHFWSNYGNPESTHLTEWDCGKFVTIIFIHTLIKNAFTVLKKEQTHFFENVLNLLLYNNITWKEKRWFGFLCICYLVLVKSYPESTAFSQLLHCIISKSISIIKISQHIFIAQFVFSKWISCKLDSNWFKNRKFFNIQFSFCFFKAKLNF